MASCTCPIFRLDLDTGVPALPGPHLHSLAICPAKLLWGWWPSLHLGGHHKWMLEGSGAKMESRHLGERPQSQV